MGGLPSPPLLFFLLSPPVCPEAWDQPRPDRSAPAAPAHGGAPSQPAPLPRAARQPGREGTGARATTSRQPSSCAKVTFVLLTSLQPRGHMWGEFSLLLKVDSEPPRRRWKLLPAAPSSPGGLGARPSPEGGRPPCWLLQRPALVPMGSYQDSAAISAHLKLLRL